MLKFDLFNVKDILILVLIMSLDTILFIQVRTTSTGMVTVLIDVESVGCQKWPEVDIESGRSTLQVGVISLKYCFSGIEPELSTRESNISSRLTVFLRH